MSENREAAFKQWWATCSHNGVLPKDRTALAREAYYAAWGGSDSHSQLASAKPVAWRFRHVNYVDWSFSKERPKRIGLEVQPLFALAEPDREVKS